MKIGHIEIRVRQYADGRWGFDDYSRGPRHKVRLLTKQKADGRAADVAVLLANGRGDLLQIDARDLAEFRRWKMDAKSSRPIGELINRFLKLKQNKSSRHLQSITRDLRLFREFVGENFACGNILAEQIQDFLDSRGAGERRRFNLRATIISLFRWARRMSYLDDRTTEAEKVEPLERSPGKAQILSPAQMRVLIENVAPEFLPWLVIAGFAGIRSEEIAPDPNSSKSPLKWEDFDWGNNAIIIRAETAKTKEEREVPILDNLAEWLAPYRLNIGRVCARQPSKRETARLGAFIGGWKNNALRDSFCSYRARITQNIPQVSYEMGNSIAMVKRCYHRHQPIVIAIEWNDIRPTKPAKVIKFA
jgi:integrase